MDPIHSKSTREGIQIKYFRRVSSRIYQLVIKYVCYPPIDTCVVIQSPIPYSVVNHIIQFDENSTGNRTTGRNSTVQYCITIIQDKSVIKPIENCIFTHPNCIG